MCIDRQVVNRTGHGTFIVPPPLLSTTGRSVHRRRSSDHKCKCIHIGHGIMDEEYKIGDAVLGRTTQEKDLGVTFSADMKVSKKYIDKLERIQRRATKMNPELRDLSYESRLLQCGLTTLETRRLRGDQIEVFKIVNGYEDVDRNMFFKLKEGSRTRGHKAALVKEQCRLDMRKYSFSQRVINEWNKLPNKCVNASSVNMFKNRIDRYLIRAGYTQMRKLLDSR